jgi:hypothetical protein
MRLLLTNDGVYGVDNGHRIVWFEDVGQACVYGEHHKNGWMREEFIRALDECIKLHHDVAEFGVNGTFMFSNVTEGM